MKSLLFDARIRQGVLPGAAQRLSLLQEADCLPQTDPTRSPFKSFSSTDKPPVSVQNSALCHAEAGTHRLTFEKRVLGRQNLNHSVTDKRHIQTEQAGDPAGSTQLNLQASGN